MIPVTKPFLPPVEEFNAYVEDIWKRKWLTNMGPLASHLETKLKDYLNVRNLLFVTNGTIALQMAIKALNLSGEVITTPFSFVATTSSIVWEGCTPKFVDIDDNTLNIDSKKIEASITAKTSAILATHVYGNPCDVEEIERIARKYNLKVIFDGAHSFGVTVNGRSIFDYGDITTCSLHATKLYHSIEGGLLVAKSPDVLKKLSSMRNFGISGSESFTELGINGKNSEFHAAMGLANLPYVDQIYKQRKLLTECYNESLGPVNVFRPKWHAQSASNYAYYPLVFENEDVLLGVKAKLDKHEVFSRRYFYPSLASVLPYLKESPELPIADSISSRVLCLPLYFDLTVEEVKLISALIIKAINNI
ncbi:DegT/DnrJ/EryC1/StrS aminotransferase family protein [Sphingobacterium sp. JB170]|uniref:DegT/DnrJ/EryC1/StrS family aminotransferase n=1 Tax=Sphingobacterium sp. JB170 TaxID=1434842 RepID=UPI00097F5D4D|nr:DegT/DnrJ/EryC1/StrS family aminotransferase [Sphingobacterium sp. JB170]SJN28665.1 UDP-4-amino-4-deoxy-L-arabinose--oxoglutarate aminotransferase [Sphingobacterium sp. JB170]